jgi:D-3-phosphoglycerate dehydrogenase / 2-oxoglutarate reductase
MSFVVVLSNISRSLPGWTEAGEILRAAGHDVFDPGAVPPAEIPADRLRGADAWLVGMNLITRDLIGSASRLRVIARPGVGVDNIDLTAATEFGVPVCNTPGSNADVVADHTLALMLVLTRDLFRLDALTRSGRG